MYLDFVIASTTLKIDTAKESNLMIYRMKRIIDEKLSFFVCNVKRNIYIQFESSFLFGYLSFRKFHKFHANIKFNFHRHHHFPNMFFSHDPFNGISCFVLIFSKECQTQSWILQTFLIKELCWPRRLALCKMKLKWIN